MADRRLERVLPVDRWPSAEEARRQRWFQPLTLASGLVLAERTWVPAMVPWRATLDGQVTDAVVDWYRRFAAGQPGVIVLEATGIRDVPSGPLLRIGHDRYIDGLRRVVDAVASESGGRTQLFIQLIDFLSMRRRPARDKFYRRFLVVDGALRDRAAGHLGEPALRTLDEAELRERLLDLDAEAEPHVLDARQLESLRRGHRERVTDTHEPHIAALPEVLPGLFADAAGRAVQAGFDGVELHYAHAYTMASFLSPLNERRDGYGATRAGRLRLPLEVYEAVRDRVGARFSLGCRFLGDEVVEGGGRLDDAVQHGLAFARAGMDFLSVSKGGKFEDARAPEVGAAIYPYTGPSGHECMPTVKIDGGPFGRNVPLAAEIRAAVRGEGHETPVVTAGGICSPWQAEAILEAGHADIVAAARQSLADPDWFRKVRLGRGGEVRRCLFTNYCEALDQRHEAVTCQRWDRDFDRREPPPEVTLTADGKRRLLAPPWLE